MRLTALWFGSPGIDSPSGWSVQWSYHYGVSHVNENAKRYPEEAVRSGFDRVMGFLRGQFLAGGIRPGDFFPFARAQSPELVDEVMEAPIAIECQAIGLACARATLADLERLRVTLDRVHATIEDPESGADAGHAFHAALVQAGRSDTLLCLYQAMTDLLRRSHRDRRELVRRYLDIRAILAQDHAGIFAAVVARDHAEADRALRRHFVIGDEHRKAALSAPSLLTRKKLHSP